MLRHLCIIVYVVTMIKLDKFDVAILEALQKDGRMTKLKLSEIVGLSQTPCHERVKRLEKSKLIRSYHASVDLNRVLKFSTFLVTIILGSHQASAFQVFEDRVRKYPEIIECYAVAGGIDYVMKVVDRDIVSYQALMDEFLVSGVNISEYYTYIVTKQIVRDSGLPVQHFFDADQD